MLAEAAALTSDRNNTGRSSSRCNARRERERMTGGQKERGGCWLDSRWLVWVGVAGTGRWRKNKERKGKKKKKKKGKEKKEK